MIESQSQLARRSRSCPEGIYYDNNASFLFRRASAKLFVRSEDGVLMDGPGGEDPFVLPDLGEPVVIDKRWARWVGRPTSASVADLGSPGGQ